MQTYSRYPLALYSFLLCLVCATSNAQAESPFGYELEVDVVYGQGVIAPDGTSTQRDLMVDVYMPSDKKYSSPRPAVILVHGGAYHRGGRRQPPYKEAGAVHSRMEDYARMLAPLGYVCFVVEYRLAPELPQPDMKPGGPNLMAVDDVVTPAGLARTNFARRAMGLPELAEDQKIILWNAAMASTEDVNKAFDFVRKNAEKYNIDPDKIAIGGHSAGGGSALNVAYGLKAPVAATFPLSPPDMIFDLPKVFNSPDLPPMLLVVSQNDVTATHEAAPKLIRQMQSAEADYEFVWVPGFAHFYPTGAVSLGDDGVRTSVGERVINFLDRHLKK